MSALQKSPPHKPGPRDERIAEMLRVDHAGEYGAVAIYRGQRVVFDRLPEKARIAGLVREMEDGEAHHLATFDALLAQRRSRPTLLAPFWNAAGFGLGAATALMGEKAAMACPSAVEDVIEKHYAHQIRELESGEPELAATVRQFRDEELEHKRTAEKEGAHSAPGHALLSAAIKFGCQAAIRIAQKV
jgi:ubiquinone biosynthesis monooxygenase Coq7